MDGKHDTRQTPLGAQGKDPHSAGPTLWLALSDLLNKPNKATRICAYELLTGLHGARIPAPETLAEDRKALDTKHAEIWHSHAQTLLDAIKLEDDGLIKLAIAQEESRMVALLRRLGLLPNEVKGAGDVGGLTPPKAVNDAEAALHPSAEAEFAALRLEVKILSERLEAEIFSLSLHVAALKNNAA